MRVKVKRSYADGGKSGIPKAYSFGQELDLPEAEALEKIKVGLVTRVAPEPEMAIVDRGENAVRLKPVRR